MGKVGIQSSIYPVYCLSPCPCPGCPGPASSGTLEDMFSLHVRASSLHNWKYWVFAQLLQPLVTSYERWV